MYLSGGDYVAYVGQTETSGRWLVAERLWDFTFGLHTLHTQTSLPNVIKYTMIITLSNAKEGKILYYYGKYK
jgi:hypothetical protein